MFSHNHLNTAESLKITFRWLKKLAALNLFFILVMGLFRLASLMIYGSPSQWKADMVKAFMLGFRFDAVVMGYVLVIPALYLIVALHRRRESWYQFFSGWIRGYYLFFFVVISCLLAVDIGYYSYFQDHLNILVFGFFEDDTWALIRTFWRNYPVIWCFVGVAMATWIFKMIIDRVLRPFPYKQSFERIHPSVMTFVSIVIIACVFMMGRGSFGLFPLGPADTVISSDPFINHLATNGIATLQRAVKLRKSQETSWDMNMKAYGYQDARQAFADFYQIPVASVPSDPLQLMHQKTPKNEWAEKTKPHVILMMMESFGTHWLSFHSADFNLMGEFEKHAHADLFLKNFLPAANSTTGSLSSMMISAPKRPLGNFLTESQYLQVPFRSSPARVFGKAGYQTRFVYGGNPGWRDMNKFARFQGFETVEGDVDIEKSLGTLPEKHDWGIYDEDVFRYVEKILAEATRPQLILVMTTTNHPPYQIPTSYSKLALKMPDSIAQNLTVDRALAEARFQTYQYSLQKLGQFLTRLKASPLSAKTIVAATGDHSFLPIRFSEEELMQKWSVPFYLLTPTGVEKTTDRQTFASHMDIWPTLYALSLSEASYDALGVNILDLQKPHDAFHDSGLSVNPLGGAIAMGKENVEFLNWQASNKTPYDRLIRGDESDDKKRMATKFRSMMAILDYYLWSERKAKSP